MVQYCELSPNVSIPVQAVNNAVLSNNLFGISFNSIHIRFIQNAPLSVALSLFSKRKEGKRGRSGGQDCKGYRDYNLSLACGHQSIAINLFRIFKH